MGAHAGAAADWAVAPLEIMLANTSAPAVLERVCCLLALNSVTSTPQWIRQPKPRDDTLVPLAVVLRERKREKDGEMVVFTALSETNGSPELGICSRQQKGGGKRSERLIDPVPCRCRILCVKTLPSYHGESKRRRSAPECPLGELRALHLRFVGLLAKFLGQIEATRNAICDHFHRILW